jgi:hypothetical protein
MREFFDVMLRLTWAMPLMVMRQFASMFSTGSMGAPSGFSGATVPQQTGPSFQAGGIPQTQSVSPAPGGGISASVNPPAPVAPPAVSSFNAVQVNSVPVNSGNLNTSLMVVLGEGLAAGVGDFTLNAETQPFSFPAQMARQMSADFPQRLIQPPGIGNFVGFSSLPIRVPSPLQTTVLNQLPPGAVSDLSVPEFRLGDALEFRPRQPLIDRTHAKQTAVNLIWGVLPIAQGRESMPTQAEYALQLLPSFIVIELGYYEALQAAVTGNLNLLPEPEFFASQYRELLSQLDRSGAELLVINIPDPVDTAHFASLTEAASLLKVPPAFLTDTYSLNAHDLITVSGFNEIGYQLFAKSIQPLPHGSTLSTDAAHTISDRISAINAELGALASEYGATLYDLASLFRRIASEGYHTDSRRLTGEYLGGFYSLNGYYPGQTGQAIIANEILNLLNRTYGSGFPLIDLNAIMRSDPVAAYTPAAGASWTTEQLQQVSAQAQVQNTIDDFEPVPLEFRRSAEKHSGPNGDWTPFADTPQPRLPLQLPPDLEQVLPLSKAASYFGDGISPVNARDPQGIQWGSSANFLFGGLAMVDSHLSGSMRIRFTPPVNDVTQFQIDFMGGFAGEDAVLVTPQYFKMGFQQNRVDAVPGTVSSGSLNLLTGEIGNLTIYARYSSTALMALVGVNPTFPKQPLSFPGQYGSAWAQFEQRPDGKLDFSFYGSTFVPLGKDIIWPLNFVGPSGQFATIPAAGTVMHPHLSLSTKEPVTTFDESSLEIPYNTLQEFTLYTHNSAFGDAFHLNVPLLGGPAKGRSHLLGRLQIQFGARTGNSVPIAVWSLPPGGIMAPLSDSPITQVFPGRLSDGSQGFNENLRFPMRTYPLDDLSIIDDPFDISVGAIDLQTGRCLNDLLHRAFISQDLIFALLRVEPRTPKDSFFFRGPALFTKDSRSQNIFRFQGIVHIPYPPGFQFPHPDFTTAFTVGPDSALDPFLWFHAIQADEARNVMKEGSARHVRASTGDEFSYHYLIPADPEENNLVFEYENHTQQGKFRMHSLAWVDFSNSGTSIIGGDEYDTVSFSGFGVWSKDGISTLQQIAVQISTSGEKPYVGIQVASGDISNVNTKPQDEQAALP